MVLTHPVTGEVLPATISTALAATILGRSHAYVKVACRNGAFPLMPRVHPTDHYRIVTAKFLRELGLLEAS